MHFFALRDFQHYMLYLLPTLLFIVLFAMGLSRMHFGDKHSDEKMNKIVHTYVGGIEERNAPFPVFLMLVLAGTVIWGILYIIFYGVFEVRI